MSKPIKYDTAYRKVRKWFTEKNWKPFDFQKEVWKDYNNGFSGLIHASTGTGKTYAIWMATILEYLIENKKQAKDWENLRVLWITPLRALAKDTQKNLLEPIKSLSIPWTVGIRTGDTKQSVRKKQKEKLPTCLISTPESLSLLLTYKDAEQKFKNLKAIVIDEWHELLSSKRGVMSELVMARFKKWNPNLKVWGLSATLGNINEALTTLIGTDEKNTKIVKGLVPKKIEVETIIPDEIERFPKAGHLGINLLPKVVEIIEQSESVLVFTNTRSQTEIWYQQILEYQSDLAGQMALHHGSLDRDVRRFVEDALHDGVLKCVVCTSSLDLGVDFTPVDKVIQIGSIKGIARLLQRAGRSGHNPGRTSKIIFVPTNAFELIEVAAVKDAIKINKIEPRKPVEKPLDLLSQHMVTIALGSGFESEELFKEVRTTNSYKNLNKDEWNWLLDFITRGGNALNAYPEFSRVVIDGNQFIVKDRRIARQHRMSIGTITSDSSLRVKFITGGFLGTIEESFISKLNKGDVFVFAGRLLTYEKIKDMTVLVSKAKSAKGTVPQWMGGRMPLSTELSNAVRQKLAEIRKGEINTQEIEALYPIIDLQIKWSTFPLTDEILIEKLYYKRKWHVFIYPFEGYLVHEGLSALLAHRISEKLPITFSLAVNDYGFEFYSDQDIPIETAINENLFSPDNLYEDILKSINSSELAKRQFREIARVAGLVFSGFPGSQKSTKQIQASSGLFYDVFTKYDPDNLLLKQSIEEILKTHLDIQRIKYVLKRMEKSTKVINEIHYPTPLSFPLIADRLRARLSSEKVSDRIEKMKLQLEKAADK